MSSRLAIIERSDGLRYGLASMPRYHEACEIVPSFTVREVRVLRGQAERLARFAKPARAPPLPLPDEIVRALIAIKEVLGGTIEDWPEPVAPEYDPPRRRMAQQSRGRDTRGKRGPGHR